MAGLNFAFGCQMRSLDLSIRFHSFGCKRRHLRSHYFTLFNSYFDVHETRCSRLLFGVKDVTRKLLFLSGTHASINGTLRGRYCNQYNSINVVCTDMKAFSKDISCVTPKRIIYYILATRHAEIGFYCTLKICPNTKRSLNRSFEQIYSYMMKKYETRKLLL